MLKLIFQYKSESKVYTLNQSRIPRTFCLWGTYSFFASSGHNFKSVVLTLKYTSEIPILTLDMMVSPFLIYRLLPLTFSSKLKVSREGNICEVYVRTLVKMQQPYPRICALQILIYSPSFSTPDFDGRRCQTAFRWKAYPN